MRANWIAVLLACAGSIGITSYAAEPLPPAAAMVAADGSFSLGLPTPIGLLQNSGRFGPRQFEAVAQLSGDQRRFETHARNDETGWVITIAFDTFGTMTYRLGNDGTAELITLTIPKGQCTTLEATSLMRAIKSAHDQLLATVPTWQPGSRQKEILLQLGSFLWGTDFVTDCVSALRPQDNWGCDCCIDSCGAHGSCCDDHDKCYERNGCSALSWYCAVPDGGSKAIELLSDLQCARGGGRECSGCNMQLVSCLLAPGKGPSECCALKICGKPRTDTFELLWR